MLKDENEKDMTQEDFPEAELGELLDAAESDSEVSRACLKDMQAQFPEDSGQNLGEADKLFSYETPQSIFDAPKLRYGFLGKLLWPLITLLIIAAGLMLFFQVLGALGQYQSKIYFLVGGVAFGLLSQTFVITGIRDLANSKDDPELNPFSVLYILNALIWAGIGIYGLYSAGKSIHTYYQAGVGLAFYIAIPALVLASFAWFECVIFTLIAKEMKR